VEVFTPAALPAFYAMPTSIPATPPFAQLPFVRWLILDLSQISIDRGHEWLPGLFSITVCCSMPSATPGAEALARPAKVRSWSRACDARLFLPFRASVSIEQPTTSPLLLPRVPLLPASIAKASATPICLSRLPTGFSFYRFTSQPFLPQQHLLLDLDTGG